MILFCPVVTGRGGEMFLAALKLENFRIFGEGDKALILELRPGLTALVGENDAGKTAIVDALRLLLGTRDQEAYRVGDIDFHQPSDGERTNEIRITGLFDGLTLSDRAAFAEYLTYIEPGGKKKPVLYINWKAVANARAGTQRRYTSVEVRSGRMADGPPLDQAVRQLLCVTYLRPLRDAERALSAGRGSRLSQILQHTKEVASVGDDYNAEAGAPDDLATLSVLGIGDFANALLGNSAGLQKARERLNSDYLSKLAFAGKALEGQITVSGGDRDFRRRQLLEKLELELRDLGAPNMPPNRGLGSNNLLFMACELLLLGSEEDGFPLLIIEEPEAHLHPQRQLRLIQFLQEKVKAKRPDGQAIQIILTTHSPNLASTIKLDNLVLLNGAKAFPLARGKTMLDASDYAFLERFLDVTKANLFFARGVLIVEGDGENLILPTIARLMGRDLTANGVSIVNVKTVGLRRYARIYQRKDSSKGVVDIPVACVADLDVMPNCAPEIVGKVKAGEEWPDGRKWRVVSDFPQGLEEQVTKIKTRAQGQRVESFVAANWTLEFDLIWHGLGREMWLAIRLAEEDDRLAAQSTTFFKVARTAIKDWKAFMAETMTPEERAARIYAPLPLKQASKTITAQYLAALLEREEDTRTHAQWRAVLPPYLVAAIDHVTVTPSAAAPETGAGDA